MGNICVIGVGYVGSVTSACLADMGNRVVGLDIDRERMADLGFVYRGIGRGNFLTEREE